MSDDPWLDRWLVLVAQRAGGKPVLELGCGSGRDTEVLSAAGHHVVAIDFSPEAIAQARQRAPACTFFCQDVRANFPVSPLSVNVVVASLSLHYFPWNETLVLARRVYDTLARTGVLLCRLNSTNDHHYGAAGHAAIDRNYYLVDGEAKRFFERADVEAMFACGWKVLDLQESVIRRYAFPKVVWEIVVEKEPGV